jgi:3-oxoacyl-[acyl-carrier-protein] synthase-3
MGTCIEAAATASSSGHVVARGARHLSDDAAVTCLERAHHYADEIDLLINAGIFKDHNVAEPALAAIIQEDIHANADGPPRLGHHGTFSFDVMNGGCGVITAAQLIDAFLARGRARLGMVVAGDADPASRTSRHFPFVSAGGAMLMSHIDGNRGFTRFSTRTFPEHAGLFESHVRWDPDAGFLHRGRNVIEVYEAPAFAQCCVARGLEVANELLEDIVPDLVIASQYPRDFATHVARGLGIPAVHVPHVAPDLTRAHTAGPIAALEAAISSQRFTRARNVLFVTCGAGLTIAAALYRG